MQNKGFVRVFAILLTLVCVFYLSFSFVTRHYTNKAKEFAKGDVKVEQDYLDSLSNEKVWFGNWTLKQCREMEISLGLDLKGGMNVILEVSVPDVIKALADNKSDEAFKEHGIFDKTTADLFRHNVLEKGDSEDPMTLYKNFRGAEPQLEPMLKNRGMK